MPAAPSRWLMEIAGGEEEVAPPFDYLIPAKDRGSQNVIALSLIESNLQPWAIKYRFQATGYPVEEREGVGINKSSMTREARPSAMTGAGPVYRIHVDDKQWLAYDLYDGENIIQVTDTVVFSVEAAAAEALSAIVEWKKKTQDLFEQYLEQETGFEVTDDDVHIVGDPFTDDTGGMTIETDYEDYGTWIFYKNRTAAHDAAVVKVTWQLENSPNDFGEEFILNYIHDRSWENYVNSNAEAVALDASIVDMIQLNYIDQEDWEHAEPRGRSRLEELGRERWGMNEREFMFEQGLAQYFKNMYGEQGWRKEAMTDLNFDYEEAAEDRVNFVDSLGDILAEYDGDEVEFENGALGYRVS